MYHIRQRKYIQIIKGVPVLPGKGLEWYSLCLSLPHGYQRKNCWPEGSRCCAAVWWLPLVRGIRDNDDRVAYLNELGWTVSAEPIATEELLIPDHFDDTYSDYLALQEGQGFDLSRYCGKRVKRYTYEITNYPTGEAGVQVALLVYRSTVIGGEVLSPTTGGFLHGLAKPDTIASPAPSASSEASQNQDAVAPQENLTESELQT